MLPFSCDNVLIDEMMKKTMMLAALLFCMTAGAQTEKRLDKIVFESEEDGETIKTGYDLGYDEQGRLVHILTNEETSMPGTVEQNYVYSATGDKVEWTLKMVSPDDNLNLKADLLLRNDRVFRCNLNDRTEEFSNVFEYDTEGKLSEILINHGKEGKAVFTWENGNITRIDYYLKNKLKAETTVQYTEKTAKGEAGVLLMPYECSHIDEMSYGQLFPYGYFGKCIKNLPASKKTVVYEDGSYTEEVKYTYELDAAGYVVGCEENEGEEVNRYTFTWTETTGVGNVPADRQEKAVTEVYSLNGARAGKTAKGVHVVKYTDGSCRKKAMR